MQGKPFEFFIMAVIIGNSALMATSFYGQPQEMSSVVEAINFAFTGIYVLEFVLKVWSGLRGCSREGRGACKPAAGVLRGCRPHTQTYGFGFWVQGSCHCVCMCLHVCDLAGWGCGGAG